jgi:RHS repeat-associated protein
VQVIDYYPDGDLRLNEKNSSFDEKNKFTGHEYDEDTSLSYMIARYQNGKTGKFLSIDPVYNAVGNEGLLQEKTGLSLQKYLENPQGLNSYSYTVNNPLKHVDPTGERVELWSRGLNNMQYRGVDFGQAGVHTFVKITPDNPKDFGQKEGYSYTLGGYSKDVNGNKMLVKGRNTTNDPTMSVSDAKLVKPVETPNGMSDTQFVNEIQGLYDGYNDSESYNLFGNGKDGYNCNNFSSSLVIGAGSKVPDKYRPFGRNPGLKRTMPSITSKQQPSKFKNFTNNIKSKASSWHQTIKNKLNKN